MKQLRKITLFLYPVSLVLNDLKFIIGGLVFGLVIFTVPDQARDNFISMFEAHTHGNEIPFLPDPYQLLFFLFIAIWTLHVWGGSRIILYLRNYRQFYGMLPNGHVEQFNTRIIWLQRFVPRILSLFPFMITGYAIYGAANSFSWQSGIYIICGILAFLFFTYRSNLFGRDPIADKRRFSMDIRALGKRYVMAIRLFGALFLLYLLLVTFSIRFSPFLRSMLIVAISINMWTYAFSWLQFLTWKVRVSLILVLLLLFSLCSLNNNNHSIRLLEASPKTANLSAPVSVEQDCHDFLLQKPDTINLIAAQGGGIRAAYWTSIVLKNLSERNPLFMKKTYAISGASGGSLGAAIFLAAWKMEQEHKESIRMDSLLDVFYSHDFLSPLTSAFLGPDVIQKFWPFPIACFDRARYLERAWEEADGSKYFGESIYNLKNKVANTGQHFPLLLLNSTWAETGLRAIIAPVKLAGTGEFNNGSLLLLDSLPQNIRLSTAVSLSSRFPFLTPGGVVKNSDGNKFCTLVDGGYVDNSGLATLLEVKDLVKRIYNDTGNSCVINMIYIENGDTSTVDKKCIGAFYEFRTVFSAFYSSWDGQDLALAHKVKTYVDEYNQRQNPLKKEPTLLFTRITLPHQQEIPLPLGWVLSKNAIEYMDNLFR